MQLKMTNSQLNQIVTLLTTITISGAKANVARYHVVKLLEPKSKDNEGARQEILKQYALLDETGQPTSDGAGQTIFTDMDAKNKCVSAINDMLAEQVAVTIDDYSLWFKRLFKALNVYDGPLDGAEAFAFGAFLDAIEITGVTKENNEKEGN
jgi:hypothetical protein